MRARREQSQSRGFFSPGPRCWREKQFAIIAHRDAGGVIEPDPLRAPGGPQMMQCNQARIRIPPANSHRLAVSGDDARSLAGRIRAWLSPSANLPFGRDEGLATQNGPTFGCVVTVALARIGTSRRTADRPASCFGFDLLPAHLVALFLSPPSHPHDKHSTPPAPHAPPALHQHSCENRQSISTL
jgi:hypothetical protein